jgi:hypothetical protein
MEKLKLVTIDGKKFFEKSFKRIIPINDYGIYTIKGLQIQAEANLNIGFKIDNNSDYVMLKGYLNNKLVPGTMEGAIDSVGDLPKGNNVYDITRLKSNPVVLVNHENDASAIAGNYIYLSENEQGLQFKLILRPIDGIFEDCTKDAVSSWSMGWGKAFSIGGRFFYNFEESKPEENLYILVKAVLHEASLVAIGADMYALSSAPDTSKSVDKAITQQCSTLENAIAKYLETGDDSILAEIEKIKKDGIQK